jgi:hypothetical protein
MSEAPIHSGDREIELIDFSFEAFADTTLAENIELLGGLADGRHSPETHWPIFWRVFHKLSLTPDHPCDRDAIAQSLIQAYHRFTPEQQYVICDFYFAAQMQEVLGWWVADWQKQVVKQMVNMPSHIWDFQAARVRERKNDEYSRIEDARSARRKNNTKAAEQLPLGA